VPSLLVSASQSQAIHETTWRQKQLFRSALSSRKAAHFVATQGVAPLKLALLLTPVAIFDRYIHNKHEIWLVTNKSACISSLFKSSKGICMLTSLNQSCISDQRELPVDKPLSLLCPVLRGPELEYRRKEPEASIAS
jgi:hypothetical protein